MCLYLKSSWITDDEMVLHELQLPSLPYVAVYVRITIKIWYFGYGPVHSISADNYYSFYLGTDAWSKMKRSG